MSTVTAFEAKTRFGELLERVRGGEEVVITRHNKPVARLVPEGERRLEQVRSAVRTLRALRGEMRRKKQTLSDEEIFSARDEGRR